MIHVAPCSCELHQALREALERNRELEAELAETQGDRDKWVIEARKDNAFWTAETGKEKARAEKAEAQVEEMVLANRQWIKAGKEAQAESEGLKGRLSALQARVAELEALLQRAIGFGLGGTWEHEAATLLEGQEREADQDAS